MSADRIDTEKLKHELTELQDLQNKAHKQATFGGMSEEEAKAYDARQNRIREIVLELEKA